MFRRLWICLLISISYVSVEPSQVPVIDIESWVSETANPDARAEVVRKITKACREIGFFAIQNHGMNQAVIEEVWEASRTFFDLPLEQKIRHKSNDDAEYPYGYENSEKLQRGKGEVTRHADLKETFSIGPYNPDSGMPSRRIPGEPASFAHALDAYYRDMEVLAQTLLRIFAASLNLSSTWFEGKMSHHISALRLLNYFQVPVGGFEESSPPLRASPHTDYGPLTILLSGGPGLQVKKDIESDAWVSVPHLPNTFIVNLGDMMQRWTNGRFLSLNS